MSTDSSGKIKDNYPYALDFIDMDLHPQTRMSERKLTPEQVARSASMKPGTGTYYGDSNIEKWASLRGNKNASKTYVRDLKYRTKYREQKAYDKLRDLKEHLENINPNTDPRLYAKIARNLKITNTRLGEILKIKEKYGFE